MSLAEVTRKCFQSGLPASQWLDICHLLRERYQRSSADFENDLSNSVLTLFHTYPADPLLQSYLTRALQLHTLSLPILLITFLQAAKSSNMHHTATLSTLCTIIQSHHYTSNLSPQQSLISPNENPLITMGTIRDALHLLQTALTLPVSPFHSLLATSSQLVLLLISCLPNIKHVPATIATLHFVDAHNLLQDQRLTGPIRSALENLTLSLSIVLGDDGKMAHVAQMAQNLHIPSSRDDTYNSAEHDNISCCLFFNFLLITRSKETGAGDTTVAVSMLNAIFRRNLWTPASFYTQLLLSATRCLAHSKPNLMERKLWRSFIVSRLSHLLVLFEQAVGNEASSEVDWKSAMQSAITALHNNPILLEKCDIPALPKFLPTLLHFYTTKSKLIDAAFTTNLDPRISSEFPQESFRESVVGDVQEFESLVESRLFTDANGEDNGAPEFIGRVVNDYTSHAVFSEIVFRKFQTLTQSFDMDNLSHLCKSLLLHPSTIDILSIHVKIGDVISNLLVVFEECDCESVGDPQTVVSRFGDIVLFLQWVLTHFGLHNSTYNIHDRVLKPQILLLTATIYKPQELNTEDSIALTNWSKALFDSASEGIEDNILRSTKPKTLLKLTATLIMQAITSCSEGRLELDVLNNGVSYFKGPLLNWSLVGVIKALIEQIKMLKFVTPVHFEILQNLLETDALHPCVVCLTAHDILRLRLVAGSRLAGLNVQTRFNPDAARDTVIQVTKAYVNGGFTTPHPFTRDPQMDNTTSQTPQSPQIHIKSQPQQSIREVLMANRSETPAYLNINRSVAIIGSIRFLQTLWQEISVVAQMGDIETCRRLAAFVLTCPPTLNNSFPPLLPLFLSKMVPHLLYTINTQKPAEQTANIRLLVKIIISSLTGLLHMEWVMHTMDGGEKRDLLKASSGVMGRRFVTDLRDNKLPIAKVLLERLASTTTFVANFPMFAST